VPEPTVERVEPVNDIEMHYEARGAGTPLLLVHGFMGCGANWRLVFPDSPKGVQLIAPDLRGHGRSTNPGNRFTLRQAALDVIVLLDRLGIRQTKAIGLSGGGQVLLHIATIEPSRMDAMVLVSTAHYFPESARAIMRQTTPENRSDEEWRTMRSFHAHGDEQIRALWRQAHAFKDSHDDPNFSPEQLAAISARTLIVHGDADPLYPVTVVRELQRSIPGADLWLIPGGGHGPIFGAQAAAFVERALAFLE
jgi:pimeloyl-ACP methyl ester carboxylesterase